ncbi:MAG: DUF1156 domain-containing protein [Gammaproteobacteria bacterium]|nr:DUF1156 domain-containing protein [Gammaproteobacteria bacterium]
MSLDSKFDITFVAALASREKQIQQSYRPIIGIHKWFARRPGSVFRSLLLGEFSAANEPLDFAYWKSHDLQGVVADPFMGGGTPLIEATRLGLNTVGIDINPMGTSKNALFPRLRRQLRARILMYDYTLRFCARCFLALTKKLLFLEAPLWRTGSSGRHSIVWISTHSPASLPPLPHESNAKSGSSTSPRAQNVT